MLSKHPPTNPVPYQGKLTIANAITDVTRLAEVEGDGATYPASMAGVWPAATNYCEYGNSAGTGWAAVGAGGLTPSTVTDWGQFGGQSIRFGRHPLVCVIRRHPAKRFAHIKIVGLKPGRT